MKTLAAVGAALCAFTALAQSSLQVEPVNSYFCVAQQGSPDNVVVAEKVHYFHQDNFDPEPLPPQSPFFGFCHNRSAYGDLDSPLFPRLGHRRGVFHVFAQAYEPSQMYPLHASTHPLAPETLLGYVVPTSVSGTQVYCPSVDGIDTEELYALAPTPARTFSDALFAARSELEQGWFYMKNGVPTRPASSRERARTLYVYWPINPTTPFVKSAGQELYKIVVHPLSQNRPDRSLGCVPKFPAQAPAETLSVGESCAHDVECSTLLCSRYTNRCATAAEAHQNGSECFASFQCQSEVVNVLQLTYVGTDPTGGVLCRDVAHPRRMNGICAQNVCTPPSGYREAADPRCL